MDQQKSSRKWVKWVLGLTIAAVVVFACIRVYFRMTDDFRVANITYEQPHNPSWDISALSTEEKAKLHHILDQKFTYIGKGAQSYAFGSADGKYVLKFFKFKHMKPSVFLEWMPPFFGFKEYKEKQRARKLKNLNSVFAGYRLAYEQHKDDSGIIFVHLNKTDNLHEKVTLVNKIGWETQLDLDPIVFIVQERARTTKDVIGELLEKGDLAAAKQKYEQMIDLYLSEYKKGIYDRDHGVMHNTGFVGNHPIHLDVGKLSKDDSMKQPDVARKDMDKIMGRIGAWLQNYYPQYHDDVMKDLNDKIDRSLKPAPQDNPGASS